MLVDVLSFDGCLLRHPAADSSVFGDRTRDPDLDRALSASRALFSALRDLFGLPLVAADSGVDDDDSDSMRCLAAHRKANVRFVRVDETAGADFKPPRRRSPPERLTPALHVESASLPASDMSAAAASLRQQLHDDCNAGGVLRPLLFGATPRCCDPPATESVLKIRDTSPTDLATGRLDNPLPPLPPTGLGIAG
jgi:hypothetical protein